MILEYYEGKEATAHNMWMCGPQLAGLALVGLLEMVKSAVALDQLSIDE